MEIYFQDLVRKLDKERNNWRLDTIILLDNAPYHTSPSTINVLKELQIPVMFTGPHSFDAVPCELMFARFKSGDINPNKIPLNKT